MKKPNRVLRSISPFARALPHSLRHSLHLSLWRPLRMLSLCLLPLAMAASAAGQVPTTLNYQGRLLQNTTDQDAVNGSVDILFSIWTGPSDDLKAEQIWSEMWTGVSVSNGIFSVMLGSNGTPIEPQEFQDDSSLYLQLEVDGETLTPRQQLGSTPFAFVDDPDNELQDLSLTEDTLELTQSGVSVDLSAYDQDLDLAGNSLSLSGDPTPVDLSPYIDDTDEQDLELTANTLSLTNDPTTVDLAPYLDNTDEQDLSLSGNTLALSNDPSHVDLAPYLDNTDAQDLSLAGNSLALTNDGTPVDLAPYLDNTDGQSLSLSGDTLTISGSDSSVDLGDAVEFSSLSSRLTAVEAALTRRVFVSSQTYVGNSLGGLSGADAKCQALADAEGLNGRFRAWLSDSTTDVNGRLDRLGFFELVNGAPVADSWAALTDGTLSNAIAADEAGNEVVGAARVWTGTEIDCSAASDLCSDWNGLGESGQSGTATADDSSWTAAIEADDCSATGRLYCFEQVAIGVDDQMLSLVGDELRLTSDNGTDVIDLSAFLDDTTLDNQVLSLSGSSLLLTSDDGTDSVSLASFLDNTDQQTLDLTADTLTVSGSGSTVDLAAYLDNTDAQTLNLTGDTLTISESGSAIDLAAYLDNTDSQTLTVSGNNLVISNGNTVSLSAFKDNTDNQDINSVLSNGANANNRDIYNLDDVDIDKLTIDDSFECDASSAACIDTEHIENDAIGGNDIQDNIYILHIDCNGSCADMSMKEACNVIENLRGLSVEVELIGVSCVYDIPSTTGNGFVACNDGTEDIGDNECRAFNLRTLGDIPCIDGTGTDAMVTCLETDIAK